MAHREFTKPILEGKGATDYERYLHTDELLALQKAPEELLHPDEMTFLVVHQASELLMKGGAFELGRALDALERGDYKQRDTPDPAGDFAARTADRPAAYSGDD